MKEAVSVYQQGVIAKIEQFTYKDEALRLYVVYSYYDREWNLLRIGRSRNFYNVHTFNNFQIRGGVEYVGFVFCENEAEAIEKKKLFKGNPDLLREDFIVSRKEMERHWIDTIMA